MGGRGFIAVLVLLPGLWAQARPPKLTYGGDAHLPPYEYLDAAGNPQGFNVELIRTLARQTGIPIEIHLAPWHETIVALEAGRIDFASLSYSPAREAKFDFLPEHWTLPQDMLFKPGRASYPGEIDQLAAETVAVEEGAMMHEVLRNLPAARRPALRPVPNGAEGLRLLSRSEVTAVTGSGLTLRWAANELGVQNLQSVTIRTLSYRFATHRGNGAALAPIAAGVAALQENGRIERLVEQFLTIPPRRRGWLDYAQEIAFPVTILLAVLAAVFTWNRSLRWQVNSQTRELRMSEEQFRDLAETLSVGILIHRGGRLLFANRIFRRMFGERLPVAAESGESQVRTLSGEDRWIQAATGSARFEGSPAEVVTIVDVTGRKQAEDNLRHSQRLEAIGKLAGGVAHDFNNLLTVIKGYVNALSGGLSSVSQSAALREIDRAADRATSLTRQLLAFSRRQMLQPSVLSLNDVVSSMDQLARRLIGEDIQLEINLEPEVGLVKADQGQVEQVLMNLLVNARDAMPQGGLIRVSTANREVDEALSDQREPMPPGSYVRLAVADNGAGMDEVTIARIFEPFFTTKEVGKGTGLGLSMVYGIVKQSNGFIWASSQSGQGAVFEIYLPRIPSESAPGQALTEPLPSTPGPVRETILVAEDEDSLRRLMEAFLVEQGYGVLSATSGKDALDAAEAHPGCVDLLITDVTMLGMNGHQLAERLQRQHPRLKALFISGYTDRQSEDCLLKPFSRAALLGRVRTLLDSPAMRGEDIVGSTRVAPGDTDAPRIPPNRS